VIIEYRNLKNVHEVSTLFKCLENHMMHGRCSEHKACDSFFFTNLVQNIFHPNKYLVMLVIHILVSCVKWWLKLCLIKQDAMKIWRGVEVQLHSFLR
jgi:hypothetical protein